MHYYIQDNDKVKQVPRGIFQAHLKQQLTNKKLTGDLAWVSSAMATAESGDPHELTNESKIRAFNLIQKALVESTALEEVYLEQLAAKEEAKGSKVSQEQKAVLHAQEAAVALRHETMISSTSRLQAIVGDNFDVVTNGGLVIKEGAKLTKEEGFTLVSSLTVLAKAGEQLIGVTSLALGDALIYIEDTWGDDLDYTQVMEQTGKSESLVRASRMISRQFPALQRQEIDPDGNLGFSHWQELSGRKKLSATVKTALAKMVAVRGASSPVIRDLCGTIAELPEGEQEGVVNKLSREINVTDAAVQVTKKFLEDRGLPTGDKIQWLYFKGSEIRCSNALNDAFLKQGFTAVKFINKVPKWTKDGLTFTDVPFIRTAPDSLVPDAPTSPVVTSEEEDEVEYGEEQEKPVYGDFVLSKGVDEETGIEGWRAIGTIEGLARKVNLPASTLGRRDALNKLEMHWKLDLIGDDYFDEAGNLWRIYAGKVEV